MLWEKGIKEFVEAGRNTWETNNNTEYYLVGGLDLDNPNAIPEEWMLEIIKHPAFHWTSFVDDVYPWLERSDIVVLPSQFREGVPKSLLEAAAMEKPIIATDVPGCREIVQNGVNGILVPAKNVEALSKSMIDLSENQVLRETMGKAGRRRAVEHFDINIVNKKTIELYEK